MRGQIIVIEGTDCSGKQTQSTLLEKQLKEAGKKCVRFEFPMYDTPTGKMIGGPYLGKSYICDGWFKEGADKVDPKVAALYYAADRRYNMDKIVSLLNTGVHVILDRYTYSNMAHQGGKIKDTNERLNMYAWLDVLEFKLLELPKPDIAIFLHMPYEAAEELRKCRFEKPDQLEMNPEHLKHAEQAYQELAQTYHWKTIECAEDGHARPIDEIGEEIYRYMKEQLSQ